MKKNILIFVAIILFISTGCDSKLVEQKKFDENLENIIKEYTEKNDLTLLGGSITDDEEVIVFENDYKYGIASFYKEDESNEIKHNISIIDKSDKLESVVYAQIKAKQGYYIGVFIIDEKLASNTDQIEIQYLDQIENAPISTQVSLGDGNSQIIESSYKKIREIKTIKLYNSDFKEIYKLD